VLNAVHGGAGTAVNAEPSGSSFPAKQYARVLPDERAHRVSCRPLAKNNLICNKLLFIIHEI
jgi:hypothetical protein